MKGTLSPNPLVFTCGGENFRLDRILAAADFRNEARPLRARLAEAVACVSYGEDEKFVLDDDLNEAADSFRVARGLYSAEETDRWMRERKVSLDDFDSFLARLLYRRRFEDRVVEILKLYEVQSVEVERLVWPEIVFSGLLPSFVMPLARRVAVAAEGGEDPPDDLGEAVRQGFLGSRNLNVDDLPKGLHEAGIQPEWFERLVDLEARFHADLRTQFTEERCRRVMASDRIGFTHVEVDILETDNIDVARELYLSIRDDGLSAVEAGREADLPVREVSSLLSLLSEELRQVFFSAGEGEVLEPQAVDGSYLVYHLKDKRKPEPSEPEAAALLQEMILGPRLARLVEKHVTWKVAVEG